MWTGAARTLGALAVTALLQVPATADFRTTHELIKQHGYPVEMHQVVTEDGYILNMHRIPHSARRPVAPDSNDDNDELQHLAENLRDEIWQREAKQSGEDEMAPMKRLSIHEYLDPCRGDARRKSATERRASATASEGSATSAEGSAKLEEGSAKLGEGSAKLGEGSAKLGEGSARLGEEIARLEGSARAGEGSVRAGERSVRAGEGSGWLGEGSARTEKESAWTAEEGARMLVRSAEPTDASATVAQEGRTRLDEKRAWTSKQRVWMAEGRIGAVRPAVFLQHGVLASSLDWVLTGPGKALGFKLSDAGYDVWLGNFRGTFYSRQHVNMTTDDPAYWNYSWDELGMFDLAAMVDYVLWTTGQRQLHFVGHSMGATVAVVLLAERPEYNEKLKVTVLLAPVVRLRHNTSVFRHYSAIWSALQKMTSYSGMRGFPPDPQMLHRRLSPVCRERYIGQGICANILHTVAGYAANINNTLLPMLFGHYPSQTSIRTLSHFLQGMNTGNFSKFDYGGENMARYRQLQPPDYGVNRITSVTAIFYGDNDPFTSPEDVAWLAGELPNLAQSYLVPSHAFSHLSFLWALDVDTVLYEPLLRLLDHQLRH